MKIKIVFLILTLLVSFSYPQFTERDNNFLRDFVFNPETEAIKNNIPSELLKISDDTTGLPYIKNNFMVNQLNGDYGADQKSVSAAIDGNGNYAVTWIDYRNAREEIFAQFYNSNDEKIGNNFKVNDDPVEGNNQPFITSNKNGDFVIVWLRNFSDVMAQRFTREGVKVGNNIKVNTVWGMNTNQPSAAVNDDGSFIVVWSAETGDWNYKVYVSLVDVNGNLIKSDIMISDPQVPSHTRPGKGISIDEAGNYCLVWSASSNIYLQMLNKDVEKIGTNIIVSNPFDSSIKHYAQVTSMDNDYFFVAWEEDYGWPDGGSIKGRIYNSGGLFITDEFIVDSSQSSWMPFKISSYKDSLFLVYWHDNGTTFLKKIKSNGEPASDTVRVNFYLNKPIYAYNSGLTDIYNSHFFITPEFYNRNDHDIYIQKYNLDFQPVGSFQKISDDYASSNQKKPVVKFNKFGESIILWEDRRNGRTDLYARILDKNFNPVGNDIQINNTDADYWFINEYKVECLSDGTFVIAFSGSESYDQSDVFLQLVNKEGEKIGTNKLVKERFSYYDYNVALNINSDDEILVVCYFSREAFLRKYDKNLSTLLSENNFIHNTNPIYYPFSISIDSEFNILAVWREYNSDSQEYDNKIRGRFFDENGTPSTEIFIVDSLGLDNYITNLQSSNYERNYIVLYSDGYKVHLKRTYAGSDPINNEFYGNGFHREFLNIVYFYNNKVFISYNSGMNVVGYFANDNKRTTQTYLLHTYYYIEPYYENFNGSNSADIFNGNLLFAYENSINGSGHDIWSNIRKTDFNFDKENFYPPSNKDILYPNFPNPFNPKTKIAYQLLAYHKVKLSVYDIIGREVKILVAENQEAGIYEVEFDASGLASGIYFCRLEAFNTNIRKMILLK